MAAGCGTSAVCGGDAGAASGTQGAERRGCRPVIRQADGKAISGYCSHEGVGGCCRCLLLLFPGLGARAQKPLFAPENKFELLCQLTGGIVLPGQVLSESLGDFAKMLHGRYILEFPRPRRLVGMQHSLDVSIRGKNAIIFSAGLSMKFPTPEEKAAGNQATEPSSTPKAGTRRILTPQP